MKYMRILFCVALAAGGMGLMLTCGCSKIVNRLVEPLMSRELSAGEKQQVEIVYAVVPRSALPAAVKDPSAALDEETKMLTAAGERKVISDFVTVIFVANHSRLSPLIGTFRVWTPVGWVDVNAHSITTNPPCIYVVDGGGGAFLSDYWTKNAKKSEWVSLKALS